MATLVMTIDSDSETEATDKKRSKSKKQLIVKEEDEEILLAHSVILDDKATNSVPILKVGSSTQWKFTDVL